MSRYEDTSRVGDRRDRRKAPGRKSALGSFVTTLLLVIAVGVFGFSAWKLVGYYLDYKAGTDEYAELAKNYTGITTEKAETEGDILQRVESLEDPGTVQAKVDGAAKGQAQENGEEKTLPYLVNPINFTELNAINDEIIGWVRIGALDVSYPIAQAADNEFYLHRTFEKKDNFAGCIFLNYTNSRYFTDQNSIVYGHNMKNGSMFGTLKNFRDQKVYDSNPYFWIFTPALIYQYRIFSAREVALTADCDVYHIRYTAEDYQTFLNNASSQSEVDTQQVTVTTDDRVTTLSTCTGNDTTRFIVQGALEQIYIAK